MNSKGRLSKGMYLPLALAALIGMIALLDTLGVIEIHGLLNKQIQGNLGNIKPNLEGYKCPVTKEEAGCGSRPSGPNGPVVDTVNVPVKCGCPSGTDRVGPIITGLDGGQRYQCACWKING